MSILVSLLLCIMFFMSGGVSSCIEKERQALLDVKANLIDPNGNLDDWGSEGEKTDCCKWSGVTCDSLTSHVIKLELFSFTHISFTSKISSSLQVLNRLQTLDLSSTDFRSNPLPNFLGSFSNLEYLYISYSNLSGPIPLQLANLSNLLHLDLSGNSLRGSIPFSLGDLTSLIHLDLSKNQLRGDVPKSLGTLSSLVYLDLSQNFLNGSMPYSISLPNLEHLDVSRNSLNGRIPNFIGCSSLSYLNLSGNHFFGNVPNSLGHVSNLTYLDFSSNSLDGIISKVHFLNLTQLYYLDLSFNSVAVDLHLHDRIPFQLLTIKLQSCKLGPGFPLWIKSQEIFEHIDISNAGISDSIPDWFWDLPVDLKFLNISSNQIEGMIPNIVSSFNDHPGMDLSNNQFRGRVPSLPSSLAAINLSGNKFSGTLSFLCNFDATLTFLDLSDNLFSGSVPDCWMEFHEKLVVLSLSNNNLSGEIPSSLGTLSNLEALYMRKNSFVGEVPTSLSNCTKLRFVDIGENKLSGVIPKWIGEELSELYVLVLGSNRFYGRLPSQLCWLHNLHVFDLSNNGLSGSIPRCFDNFTAMARRSFGDDMITSHTYSSSVTAKCRVLIRGFCYIHHNEEQFLDNAWVTWKGTKLSFGRSGLQLLKSIDLSRNNLSGKLPYEITSLLELVSLNLSVNKLHGEVPKDMGRLKSLESLDLSSNEFSGRIPSSLSQMTFLSYLDLSNNNLSGEIPVGSQLQRFNYTSYSGNPQLCGPPLTPSCRFSHVVKQKDVKEYEDEDDSWKSYYIGMGSGFAVGFLGICGALVLNNRCRYFFFASLSYMKDWIYVTAVVHFGKLVRKFKR